MLVTLGTHMVNNVWFSCFIASVKQRLTSSTLPEAVHAVKVRLPAAKTVEVVV